MEKKPRYTLGKKERLKSRKAIEQIFEAGQGFSMFPFRVTWMIVPEPGNANQEMPFRQPPNVNRQQADGSWQMAEGGKRDNDKEEGNANQKMPFRQPLTANRQQADGRWQMAEGWKTDNVNEEENTNQEMPFCQPSTVNRQQADGRWQRAEGGKRDNDKEEGNANQEMPFRQPPTVNRQPFLQVAFSVPRRQFKRAVDRNRIRRQMREAWRLQKLPLQEMLPPKKLQLRVFLIFTGRELPPWPLVQEKILHVIKRLQKAVHEKPADHP